MTILYRVQARARYRLCDNGRMERSRLTIDIHPYGTLVLERFPDAERPDTHPAFIEANWEALAGFAYIHYREQGGGLVLLSVEEHQISYVTPQDESLFRSLADSEIREMLRLYDPEFEFVILIVCGGKKPSRHAYRYGAKNMTPRDAASRLFGSILGLG